MSAHFRRFPQLLKHSFPLFFLCVCDILTPEFQLLLYFLFFISNYSVNVFFIVAFFMLWLYFCSCWNSCAVAFSFISVIMNTVEMYTSNITNYLMIFFYSLLIDFNGRFHLRVSRCSGKFCLVSENQLFINKIWKKISFIQRIFFHIWKKKDSVSFQP